MRHEVPVVTFDAGLVERVFVHQLENAVKHGDSTLPHNPLVGIPAIATVSTLKLRVRCLKKTPAAAANDSCLIWTLAYQFARQLSIRTKAVSARTMPMAGKPQNHLPQKLGANSPTTIPPFD